MLLRRHDAAAVSNALNGLFGADVVIGGSDGLHGSEPPRGSSQAASPAYPGPARQGKRPAMPTGGAAPATTRPATTAPAVTTGRPSASRPAPAPAAGGRRGGDPGARLWAAWVICRATSA